MLSEVPHELSIPMRTPKSANGPRSNSFRPDSPSTTNLPRGRKTQPSPSPHRTWSVPDASSQPPLNPHYFFSYFSLKNALIFLIFASYASQTLRGAIQAIPKGQWESGAALGLSRPYTFIHLIMPQVWRHALPGLSNQWLVLLKDTALVSLIGVDDLMRQAGYINTNTHEPFTWYGIAALIYLVITLISQAGIRKLELRFTRFERGVE